MLNLIVNITITITFKAKSLLHNNNVWIGVYNRFERYNRLEGMLKRFPDSGKYWILANIGTSRRFLVIITVNSH